LIHARALMLPCAQFLTACCLVSQYSRIGKGTPSTGEFVHLGYVQFTMVGSGTCLTSATVTTFYHSSRASWIPGVNNGDSVALNGNTLFLYSDASVGVLAQLNTNVPLVNTLYLTGSSLTVSASALLYSSSDSYPTVSTSLVTIGETDEGTVSTSVSAGGFSRVLNFTVLRPAVPTLQVDDSELQALPGSCSGYQSSAIRAFSAGADITRLLIFQTTNAAVLTVDASTRASPVLTGAGLGTALVFAKDPTFTNITVSVTSSVVSISSLSAGIVTSVEWTSPSTAAGPYVAVPLHELTSEASVSMHAVWYTRA
jgi:hypothetical protein